MRLTLASIATTPVFTSAALEASAGWVQVTVMVVYVTRPGWTENEVDVPVHGSLRVSVPDRVIVYPVPAGMPPMSASIDCASPIGTVPGGTVFGPWKV